MSTQMDINAHILVILGVCTVCSNKKQVILKAVQTVEWKVTTRGFQNLSTAHWLLKCCIQKSHSWLALEEWVAHGEPSPPRPSEKMDIKGEGKRATYSWNLKSHHQHHWIKEAIYELGLFSHLNIQCRDEHLLQYMIRFITGEHINFGQYSESDGK